MTAPEGHLELAGEFPAADRQQWRAAVAAVLQKSGTAIPDESRPEDALATPTYDGFDLAPLYTAEDWPGGPDLAGVPGTTPYVRGSAAASGLGWDVRQRQSDTDAAAGNRAILTELENGVSSLWLVLGEAGTPIADLGQLLDGVYLDLVSVVLDAGTQTAEAAAELLKLASENDIAAPELTGNLGTDPIGLAARTGTPADLSGLGKLAQLVADYPGLRPITVDSTVYHNAGGSDSDELAISLSVGVAYLRALEAAGRDVFDAFGLIEFRYAVTANQFSSIAKLRAARRLWDRVGELCEVTAEYRGQRQHAVTSAAMMTRRDPYVNLLRTTIACFAGAVGGASAITVAPFDSALGVSNDFGRRIARNTHSVLHDESSLARVGDPAGGSWYVESLTDALAESAWAKFTELEAAGGAVAALESGAIAELLEQTWLIRKDNLAHRRDPITGVSEFAMLAEPEVVRDPLPAFAGTGDLGESGAGAGSNEMARVNSGLPVRRYAEPFEELRDRSDARLAADGARPKVFLAGLGPLPVHAARLGFARNLLEVGGIEAVTGEPADFADSGCTAAILCSSDKVYADQAADAAAALKTAGAKQVWIAGAPKLVTGDIDDAVYAGCDALTALNELYTILESAL